MVVVVALRLPAVLLCPQLCFAPLGALVHGYLCGLNTLDCRVLLPHGVDGEFSASVLIVIEKTPFGNAVNTHYLGCRSPLSVLHWTFQMLSWVLRF